MPNPENLIPAKKGEVRNPNGRGKSLNRSTIVRKWLEAAGSLKGTQVVDDLVLAQIVKAMSGDTQAFKELMDSGFGKVTDKIDQTMSNPDGSPITTNFTIEVKK